MPRLQLSLETLGELDSGLAQGIVDAEIRRAVFDLENRGHDGKERKVVIELSMQAVEGHRDRYHTTLRAQSKLPPQQVAATEVNLALVPNAKRPEEVGLFFQAASPDRPDQETFDFDRDRKKKASGE